MNNQLKGKTVLITAGPTQEPIDAVRYISNRSSGKMGYAIAEEAFQRGAHVILISGPVCIKAPVGCELISVITAVEMEEATLKFVSQSDIIICTAAVCDMRPTQCFNRKLKKGKDDDLLSSIELTENPDILKHIGLLKNNRQLLIGFAAETDDIIQNAKSKLLSKNADLIVANNVCNGDVFGSDSNKATFLSLEETVELHMMTKRELASTIFDYLDQMLH